MKKLIFFQWIVSNLISFLLSTAGTLFACVVFYSPEYFGITQFIGWVNTMRGQSSHYQIAASEAIWIGHAFAAMVFFGIIYTAIAENKPTQKWFEKPSRWLSFVAGVISLISYENMLFSGLGKGNLDILTFSMLQFGVLLLSVLPTIMMDVTAENLAERIQVSINQSRVNNKALEEQFSRVRTLQIDSAISRMEEEISEEIDISDIHQPTF